MENETEKLKGRQIEESKEEPVEELKKETMEESKDEIKEEPVEKSEDEAEKEQIEESVEEPNEKVEEEQKEEFDEPLGDKLNEDSIEEPKEKPIEKSEEEQKAEPIEEPLEGLKEEYPEDAEKEPTEELVEKPEEEVTRETTEQTPQENKEETEEKQKQKRKKIIIGSVISICALLVIYFGMTRYFANHFYFGSEINAINISGKTVEDAKMAMASRLEDYTLDLKERNGKVEQINAADIGLKYNSDQEIEKLKDSQNPFGWISAVFNTKDSKITVGVSYDEALLKQAIDKLSCFDSTNVIEPKNPSFQYSGNSYVIVDEVLGNKIDKDLLYSRVADSLLKEETEIDLEASGCYITPKYTSKSPETLEVRDTLNKYVSSKINYTIGDSRETLDGSIINKWLGVNDNFEVTIDEKMVKGYIDTISKTYNTVGRTRRFVTSSGSTINVGDGDYGWVINKTRETQNLIEAIKTGQTTTREPAYSQTAFSGSHGSNDIGSTYVEIDLSKQHIWFYKNGSLIVQGNVVTGNVRAGHSTPAGVYRLKYKQRNTILEGPGYAVFVSYWMPFNGGVGLHDANWRSSFGGSIYKTNGSHGCVNMPFSVAQAIYNNISVNTPVVVY